MYFIVVSVKFSDLEMFENKNFMNFIYGISLQFFTFSTKSIFNSLQLKFL